MHGHEGCTDMAARKCTASPALETSNEKGIFGPQRPGTDVIFEQASDPPDLAF